VIQCSRCFKNFSFRDTNLELPDSVKQKRKQEDRKLLKEFYEENKELIEKIKELEKCKQCAHYPLTDILRRECMSCEMGNGYLDLFKTIPEPNDEKE
jgi:hypothetical protein